VRAETQEEAENEVIMWAGGVPEDWEVTDAFEKTEFASDHGGIM
jgi:hypothetical protein